MRVCQAACLQRIDTPKSHNEYPKGLSDHRASPHCRNIMAHVGHLFGGIIKVKAMPSPDLFGQTWHAMAG
jgi:hypothetical protein